VPVSNLVWAPIFVIELAGVEERLTWLRRPIVAWWLTWVASTAVSAFSIATSFAEDAQGIADNTVTTIVAYLLALAALLLAFKVFVGFERQPVERPSKRWVVVADKQAAAEKPVEHEVEHEVEREKETAAAVESKGQDPAA
jgi:type VI protein secretion system component VasK